MSSNKIDKFTINLLMPQYWHLWLGIAFFRMILALPYPCICKLARLIAKIIPNLKICQRRIKIAQRNIELCFPTYSKIQQQQLLQENVYATAMAFFETGMAWFWSDRRIKKWSSVTGIEHIKDNAQHGIILVGIHFLTLELGARIIGLHHPGIGVYMSNEDKPFLNWLQIRGRIRSNKGLLERGNLKGMIRVLKQGEMVWYAPDHDYGLKNSVFVPFFAVKETASTIGTYILLKHAPNSKVIPFAPIRKKNNLGYELIISPPVAEFTTCKNAEQTALLMNQVIEQEILRAPAQYMWVHRRFKTRPTPNSKSVYS